jgi:hypothetical protein
MVEINSHNYYLDIIILESMKIEIDYLKQDDQVKKVFLCVIHDIIKQHCKYNSDNYEFSIINVPTDLNFDISKMTILDTKLDATFAKHASINAIAAARAFTDASVFLDEHIIVFAIANATAAAIAIAIANIRSSTTVDATVNTALDAFTAASTVVAVNAVATIDALTARTSSTALADPTVVNAATAFSAALNTSTVVNASEAAEKAVAAFTTVGSAVNEVAAFSAASDVFKNLTEFTADSTVLNIDFAVKALYKGFLCLK